MISRVTFEAIFQMPDRADCEVIPGGSDLVFSDSLPQVSVGIIEFVNLKTTSFEIFSRGIYDSLMSIIAGRSVSS